MLGFSFYRYLPTFELQLLLQLSLTTSTT